MANITISQALNKLAKVNKKYTDNVKTTVDEKLATMIKFNDNGDLEITIDGVTKTFSSIKEE